MLKPGPIGVFDSGYGGLTILSEFQKMLPQYDYCYLGDNSRAPYGSRSYEIIYKFTKQAVEELFARGCNLVILACNTASANALRTIQQQDLSVMDPEKRVLGIIRPTAEIVGEISQTKHIAILGTKATIQSGTYTQEIKELFPEVKVLGEACPMWVPLVENLEFDKPGADFFVKQHLNRVFTKDLSIDTLILGCTHYPLLMNKIKQYLPSGVNLISQGEYVARSLIDYLKRHPEMEKACLKNGTTSYLTTESADKFSEMAEVFLKQPITVERVTLG